MRHSGDSLDDTTEHGRTGGVETPTKRKRARGREPRNGDPSASHKPRVTDKRHVTSEGTVYSDFEETVQPLAGTPFANEPIQAIKACNDYLRLGRVRSKTKLHDWYDANPTLAAGSWWQICTWYEKYDWIERGNLYDIETEKILTAEAQQVFNTGLALPHERVLEIERLYREVKPRLLKIPSSEEAQYRYTEETGWTDENGNAPPKDIPVNTDVLQQMRGLLDDLALETGGRTKTLALFAKRDPMQALFDSLQRVAPELPSGESNTDEQEAIEADFTIEAIPGPDEAGDAGELLAADQCAEGVGSGGGGCALSGAVWGDSGSAVEPDETCGKDS